MNLSTLMSFMRFLEREEDPSTRRKTLKAQERSTTRTLSRETAYTRLGLAF